MGVVAVGDVALAELGAVAMFDIALCARSTKNISFLNVLPLYGPTDDHFLLLFSQKTPPMLLTNKLKEAVSPDFLQFFFLHEFGSLINSQK